MSQQLYEYKFIDSYINNSNQLFAQETVKTLFEQM